MLKRLQARINPRVAYTALSLLIIALGTWAAIQFARGSYRLTQEGLSRETGLLSANSFPTGAEVIIDGKLVTATDDTLYLEPNTYNVEIRKEGYSPWVKTLQVQPALVTQTNALLFPTAPSLTPLTLTSVQNIFPSPDGQKLIYYTASASAQTRNGLYLIELASGPTLSFQRGPRQISSESSNFDLTTAKIIWSPDSTEALLVDAASSRQVMLDLNRVNQIDTLADVGFRSRQILGTWEAEMYARERQFLREFPPEMIQIATQSAKNVYFSPDKKRLLYTATEAITLPEEIVPPVPATNTQPEERKLVPGTIYVYDREEDKNFKVGTEAEIIAGKQAQNGQDLPLPSPSPSPSTSPRRGTVTTITPELATPSAQLAKFMLATDLFENRTLTYAASPSAFTRLQATDSALTADNFNLYHTSLYAPTFQWFPDSKHLISVSQNRIHIKEYDNTNMTTVYSGPYTSSFVYPWPDGSRLLIVTSFSSETPNNLYSIELRR